MGGNIAGGGVLNEGVMSNAEFVNCVFEGNTAVRGGAVCNITEGSHPGFVNCTVVKNSATGEEYPGGGGMYNSYASPTVTNCILWGNLCSENPSGKEVHNYGAAADASFRCCDIENCLDASENWDENLGTDSGGNIDAPPQFTHYEPTYDPNGLDDKWMTGDDGLRLNDDSPCIDAADGDAAPQRDIRGVSRYDEPGATGGVGQPDYVEIGAYEYHPVEVHFSGGIIGDVSDYTNGLSKAFVDDTYSDIIVGLGAYADTETAIPDAVLYTLDSIAIRDGVKLTVWSGENSQGDILLEQTGPAVIYNVRWNDPHEYYHVWNAMTEDWEPAMLQYEFPQDVRKWSDTDMYVDPLGVKNYWWGKGAFKIE